MTDFLFDLGTTSPLASDGLASFYFLRHGRTEHNVLAICQGSQDIPLDEVGREQAQDARGLLAMLPIERVVASPLDRAHETARLATKDLGIGISLDPRLRERGFGSYEGSTAPHGLWEDDLPTVETRADFAQRIADGLSANCATAATLIVSHGGVLRGIASLLQVPLTSEHLQNACPLLIEHRESGWVIEIIPSSNTTVQEAAV